MNAIVLDNVTKHFKKSATRREYTTFKSELVQWLRGGRRAEAKTRIEALRGVDLVIPQGKTVGIIGRNGSGKSTLLKLITGIYTPSTGTIEVKGRISALLDLGAGFHPDFSGRENILINGVILGMSRAEVQARTPAIIEFSELGDFIDEPVRTYSSGMYMRLAFAVATHVDPEILIIDEILAVGDEHFSRKSQAKMNEFKASGKTIVLVTHDLNTLQKWCDVAAWIDGGRIRLVGEPHHVVAQYREAVALAEASGEAMTPSALSPGGGSLPSLSAPELPAAGPQVSPEKRWGNFKLEIAQVRLLDAEGKSPGVFGPDDAVEICVDFVCKEPLVDVGFSVVLVRSDGLVVYGTNTFSEKVALPNPLPSSGTVRFSIDRLGLNEGIFTLDVAAHTASHEPYDYQKGLVTFSVRSSTAQQGVVQLPHRWSVVAGSEQAARKLGSQGVMK